jgi:hypothetical protein
MRSAAERIARPAPERVTPADPGDIAEACAFALRFDSLSR